MLCGRVGATMPVMTSDGLQVDIYLIYHDMVKIHYTYHDISMGLTIAR